MDTQKVKYVEGFRSLREHASSDKNLASLERKSAWAWREQRLEGLSHERPSL